MIVGAGNSAAQILAEVSRVAHTTWATREPPRFMSDDVDGRALFAAGSRRYRERNGGAPASEVHGLGDIVMVESVKEARRRGALVPRALPARLVPDGAVWPDGRFRRLDAVIWCTASRRRSTIWRHSGSSSPTDACGSTARVCCASRGCGSSATAAGPDSHRRRSSASGATARRTVDEVARELAASPVSYARSG